MTTRPRTEDSRQLRRKELSQLATWLPGVDLDKEVPFGKASGQFYEH